MKAAVTMAPRRIEVREVPEPAPGLSQALIRVEAVGICGSDVERYLGDNPYAQFPRTQGHEFAGRVVALGEGYAGPVAVGDRVAVEPLMPCGACYPCRHGRPNCCANLKVIGVHVDGAMAELVAVPGPALYPAGDLEAELAALVEPISIGLQAVTRGAVTADDTVAVFGVGPIGQAILLAAVDRGARVLVVDRLPSRLELARQLGAEMTVEDGRDDAAAAIVEWTHGEGPAVAIDATGVPAVIRSCIDVVAPSGRVVVVGISTKEVAIPVVQFTRKELTIVGSRNNTGLFGEAVDLVRRHRDRARRLITHRYPLGRTPEAIAFALEHPAETAKVMLTVT